MNDLEGMINGILSDPDQMKKIMDMAGQIMGTDGGNSTPASGGGDSQAAPPLDNILSGLNLNNIPGGLSSVIQNVMGSVGIQKLLSVAMNSINTKNDKQELLEAMKPWLSEKRRQKVDRAM
ncbi:MAG: hypothetical protein GX488_03520, partial [Clostridiales bacterium]|nr:hypothetical protein [Clostridiales bacterium]